MLINENTVAAVSSPRGVGAISLIRMTGKDTLSVLEKCSGRCDFEPRKATLCDISDKKGVPIDSCIITYYKAPASFTGEDIAEIACHGGIYVTEKVLCRLFECGAERAGRGEFSKRAFLNGKLDLSAAKGIIDTINAESEAELSAARGALRGGIRQKVDEISALLLDLTSEFLVGIDYPDEAFEDISPEKTENGINFALCEIDKLLLSYSYGSVIKQGVKTALLGKPNSGKSSIMNLLSGEDKSIVTEIEGTTRDIVENAVRVGDFKLILSDTAGIRASEDKIERIGVSKSLAAAESADIILAVFDLSRPLSPEDDKIMKLCRNKKAIAILNKTDLPQKAEAEKIKEHFEKAVSISAKTGDNIAALCDEIASLIDPEGFASSDAIITDPYEKENFEKAKESLLSAREALRGGMTFDAVFADIASALSFLGGITGREVNDKTVDNIFSKFCVGK